ncbi:MAG: macro domain-containing protein [Puniceicoccales bacterium]|jgi:O-acetyl-ADP-ribose deacetylase (regulator of RNase III)|nr:macro domain-containing protein [Puniceicoccales bacterium]
MEKLLLADGFLAATHTAKTKEFRLNLNDNLRKIITHSPLAKATFLIGAFLGLLAWPFAFLFYCIISLFRGKSEQVEEINVSLLNPPEAPLVQKISEVPIPIEKIDVSPLKSPEAPLIQKISEVAQSAKQAAEKKKSMVFNAPPPQKSRQNNLPHHSVSLDSFIYHGKRRETTPLRYGNGYVAVISGNSCFTQADGMVNPANEGMQGGMGLDGDTVLYGGNALMEERKQYKDQLDVGKAIITSSGNGSICSKYIIHVNGPYLSSGSQPTATQRNDLRTCYLSALQKCNEYKIRDFVVCIVSAGMYNYPPDKATEEAFNVIKEWLSDGNDFPEVVYFNAYAPTCLNRAVELFAADNDKYGVPLDEYRSVIDKLHGKVSDSEE